MTTYDKTSLKTFFQTNDVPSGADYANLIDSQVNIVETSVQSMGGPLFTPELITNRVSASNIAFGGDTLNAVIGNNINFGAGNNFVVSASNNFSVSAGNGFNVIADSNVSIQAGDQANTYNAITMSTNFINVNGTGGISINIPATVSAITANKTTSTEYFGTPGIVSAAGITQGAAALLINTINIGKGVSDGSTTGFGLQANKIGKIQYLYNNGASANLWPPTGGTINGLAVNLPLSLVASAMVTILHIGASAYAVK